MVEAGTLSKRCETCQWCSASGFDNGYCREPRNVQSRLMVGPGGDEMRLLMPMLINQRRSTVCDFWKPPARPNLRIVE